ncbi:unnamed protein product [Urochloa decumbens]|uniref:F-box domain-containing protein n=1 Tax=Urochloa decumbens TaxID=240449 RepID=A0ABC9B7T2_9POAL
MLAMDDVNDDILGLILERIDSHPVLIRAAATCKRWRRAIADAGFLRRYRSLHGPTIAAGHYFNGRRGVCWPRREPWFVPSSPLPPPFGACLFSLDFLPCEADPTRREVLDTRGSLLLVDLSSGYFTDLVVCEPLTRCYVRIPAPEFIGGSFPWGLYLIDGDAVDEAGQRSIGMSNFRVMCMFDRGDVAHAGVFTATGVGTWTKMAADHIAGNLRGTTRLGRAGGSWYFYVAGGTLVALDGSTGEFSSSTLPAAAVGTLLSWDSHKWSSNVFVTDNRRDGMPRVVVVARGVMKVLARPLDDEWVLEKEVVLSEVTHGLPGYEASFFNGRGHGPVDVVTRGTGFVVLSVRVNEFGDMNFFEFFEPSAERWVFSIDIETMEAAPADAGLGPMAYPCELPWPPALQACLDKEG